MANQNPNQKQSFLHGAAVLAAATAIVKVIGAIYSIPLANIIGDEGFSYFSKAYLIYEVLLMISTTGLPVAMSRMISQAQTLDRHDQVRKIFATAFRIFLLLGILGTAGMLFGARWLSEKLAKTPDAWFSIVCLSPSVFLICCIAAFRGFFQGQSNMTPTSVSQVFEALCKLIIGLGLAWMLLRTTGEVAYSTGGALLGVTIGLVISALYLYARYRKVSRAMPTGGSVDSTGTTMKQLLAIAIPITLGSAGLQIINFVDTAVYMDRLVTAAGIAVDRANELSGIYEFCRKIFNLPCSFITPLTISIIPAITMHLTKEDTKGLRVVEGSGLRITGLIAMPCAMGLFFLGAPIMQLLRGYSGETLELTGFIMAILGPTVICNSVILVTNAIMQAHGHVTIPVVNMLIGGLVKVGVNYVLVSNPALHIKGVAIGTLICYLLIMLLNIIAMRWKKIISLRSLAALLKPMLAAVLMGICAWMANGLLSSVLPTKLACVGAIGAAAVIYVILVLAFRVITYDDCMLLPGGRKIAKILRISA